jgi:hypothetical protein
MTVALVRQPFIIGLGISAPCHHHPQSPDHDDANSTILGPSRPSQIGLLSTKDAKCFRNIRMQEIEQIQ